MGITISILAAEETKAQGDYILFWQVVDLNMESSLASDPSHLIIAQNCFRNVSCFLGRREEELDVLLQ